MSVHGGSFMSSFVKSGAVNAIPNLLMASCSIVVPFLDLFVIVKKDELSSDWTGFSIGTIGSIGVVPFVPFSSVAVPFFSVSLPFFSVSYKKNSSIFCWNKALLVNTLGILRIHCEFNKNPKTNLFWLKPEFYLRGMRRRTLATYRIFRPICCIFGFFRFDQGPF